jgi:putative sterol carrier protein
LAVIIQLANKTNFFKEERKMAKITPDMSDDDVRAVVDGLNVDDQDAAREALKDASPRQVFMIAMPHGLKRQPDIKEKLEGIEGTVVWVIEGDGGGSYAMIFGGGDLNVQEGEVADARATVTLSVDTWKKMANNETNPPMAFMQGLMKVTGDMGFLMQLQNVMPQM